MLIFLLFIALVEKGRRKPIRDRRLRKRKYFEQDKNKFSVACYLSPISKK